MLSEKLERWLRLSRLSYPVPPHARHLFYTLGGITFAGFLLLFATGVLLAQFFNPLPDQAYQSVTRLREAGGVGAYLRSLHYWAAQAVILSLLCHLLRVFVTGSYKSPRQATWFMGVGLLGTVVMGSYFTGTILKGDQEAFEALYHYKEIIKGLGPFGYLLSDDVTPGIPLALRLYVSHIAFFPLLLITLLLAHFYLIKVFSISPLPWGPGSQQTEVPPEERTGTFSEHVKSISLFSGLYYGVTAVFALFIPAPLGPGPTGILTGDKPPWIYLWLYGLENVFGIPAVLYGSLLVFGLLLSVPFLDQGEERNPLKRKAVMVSGALLLLLLLFLTIYAWVSPLQIHGH